MFALRKITKDGVEMNFALGCSYTQVMKETAPTEFEKVVDDHPHREDIYGFVSPAGGHKLIPLYIAHKNYIVTGEGRTFANISHR